MTYEQYLLTTIAAQARGRCVVMRETAMVAKERMSKARWRKDKKTCTGFEY